MVAGKTEKKLLHVLDHLFCQARGCWQHGYTWVVTRSKDVPTDLQGMATRTVTLWAWPEECPQMTDYPISSFNILRCLTTIEDTFPASTVICVHFSDVRAECRIVWHHGRTAYELVAYTALVDDMLEGSPPDEVLNHKNRRTEPPRIPEESDDDVEVTSDDETHEWEEVKLPAPVKASAAASAAAAPLVDKSLEVLSGVVQLQDTEIGIVFLADLLTLAGYSVDTDIVRKWTSKQRAEAAEWLAGKRATAGSSLPPPAHVQVLKRIE